MIAGDGGKVNSGRENEDNQAGTADWLVGGGEMAKLIKSIDWSETPLGPIADWPQSLCTVVSLVQASSSPISLVWGEQHTQIYNDGYWPICGDKHPEAMGQDFRECWATAWPMIGEAYESAMAGTTAYLENIRMFLDRYGFLEETWFTFSFSPITDENGEVAGLFHPVTELTRQSLSERRTKVLRDLAAAAGLSESTQDTFRLAADVLAKADLDIPFVLFYLIDADGRCAQRVAAAGLPSKSSLCPESVGLEDATAPWEVASVVRSGKSVRLDNAEGRFEGMTVGPYPEVPRTVMTMPIRLSGQERPAAVMVAGLSARLLVDDEYLGFVELVASSVGATLASAKAHETERQRAEALAELDRSKTAFFSNVSHELRTPLMLIRGPLEEYLSLAETDAQRESANIAYRNANRLLKLVNSLLDFSRIEAGRMQARFAPCDLGALTTDLASGFRSVMESNGLTLEVDCPTPPVPVYVDRSMWEKIVLNLLSNAFKHTLEGGIQVRLASSPDSVELSIADTGIGIATKELPRLFERFHRVEGVEARTYEGTGIGLSLSRELVRLHGGEIKVSSTPGKGSTFTVVLKTGRSHLPAEQIREQAGRDSAASEIAAAYIEEAGLWSVDDVERNAQAQSDMPDSSPVADGVDRPRILLADDNADMRAYIGRLLANHYRVTAVADGQAALQAARAQPPDLVLSDVMMPRLDGFGLTQALRGDERTRRIPVILVSARAGEESAIDGLEVGADDYLVKPFSAHELLARVRSLLSLSTMRAEWEDRLAESNRELRHIGMHDYLTGLLNRREFDLRLERACAKYDPDNPSMLLYLDLDRFKQVNDEAGHSAGDALLQELAQNIKKHLRPSDAFARVGGDEFCVLMANTSQHVAYQVAERIRVLLRDFSFEWEGRKYSVGVSIGVAAVGRNADETRNTADTACRNAKRNGRDRVEIVA